jgi:hypothetical protein
MAGAECGMDLWIQKRLDIQCRHGAWHFQVMLLVFAKVKLGSMLGPRFKG